MHVDAPVANLVMDEPLLEDCGLLEAGKPEHGAPVDTVERLEGPVVPVPDVVQLPAHHLVQAMMTVMKPTMKKITTSSE